MFVINSDKSIHITRGDIGVIEVGAKDGKSNHAFSNGDIIRLSVSEKNNYDNVVLRKEVVAEEGVETVDIPLLSSDTKIGESINKPVDYWYEIELNPDTAPQTLVGHDDKGAKVFRLYPESGDIK